MPLWHIPVVFLYAMRRVDCPRCGVRVEALPWATGKHRLTHAYAWFLAGWAKRLSWREVAAAFPTSWDTVYRAVRMAVDWGLAHRDLTNIEAIGVDELSRRRGQRYLTLVYQIDGHRKRLLWIGRERKAATLEGFFDWFGPARSAALYFVCSDRWKPYLKVVAERAKLAVQVLDRFHIMSHFSEAIDEVRAAEARKLAAEGPGASAQAQPLAPAQASGEAHRRAAGPAGGAGASQPAHGSRLPAQGGLPSAVGLRVAVLGGTVPRPLVYSDDALAARADEGGCPHAALAPRADPELVPSPGAVLQWRCRRLQREGQSDHQTGVRLSHLRGTGSRSISCTWRPARTRTCEAPLEDGPHECHAVLPPAGRLRQELVDVGGDRLVDAVLVASEGEADRSDVAVGEQAAAVDVLQLFLQAPERPGAVVPVAQNLAADASGVLSDAMRFGKEIEVEQGN